ncbi:MAG: FAD-dependent thymidylate synthase [Candidatus Paceibacterota bacterium]|jgi:thymidylate synthase (FAD)
MSEQQQNPQLVEVSTFRARSEGAESVLGKLFPCLDDGFVRLVDYMGNDAAIVQAARISYGKGTKKISEDVGLIRYLMNHRHTTPFEMCEFKFHVRVPMDAWRQWIRHRTASVNEYSTRYSLAIDATQKTSPDKWRLQAKDNKQGSSGFFDLEQGTILSAQENQFQELGRKVYEERVNKGMAREQARKDLPLSTYTEAYWKTDLHNLLHFLGLRLDSHAQYEIRVYAQILEEIVKLSVPATYQAFKDYQLDALRLSGPEIKFISKYLQFSSNEKIFIEKIKEFSQSMGERTDLITKLRNLELVSEDFIPSLIEQRIIKG